MDLYYPSTSTTNIEETQPNWAQFVEGLEFEDIWSPPTNYEAGDP